jgi:multidrug efflux pump subunit AcrA (membrane-fusion protein)
MIVAFVLAGCGKSEEMKRLEADLNGQVTKLHDAQMEQMKKMTDLLAGIDAAVAKTDSLATAVPSMAAQLKTDELKAAKNKLNAVKASMDEWMKTYKPYDINMKHEDAMVSMQDAKNALEKAQTQAQDAISAATAALDSSKKTADDVLAHAGTMMKKMKKESSGFQALIPQGDHRQQ